MLFSEYWEQEDHNARVRYVTARIESTPVVKGKRPKPNEDARKPHPRSVAWKYFFDIHGRRVQVCKETFLRTLGETDRFLRNAAANKSRSGSGIPHKDKRGRHQPRHKLSDEKVAAVKKHVLSYPAYESHYCRSRVDDKFLPSHLNVTIMYRQYLKDSTNPKVSYGTYLNIFRQLGRKFKQPKTDTCSKCDEYNILAKVLTGNKLEEMLRERDEHHKRAAAAYDRKREEKAKAEEDPSRRVLVLDLEQCLPTPFLHSGKMFYLRQLYVLNLTIYDTTTKLTHCYMWHEGEGGRGANQIASCLYRQILEEVPEGVKHLTVFSDSCSGQNRNSHISVALFTAVQEHPTLETIDHIFLEAGHTRMECDGKHSVIERSKATIERINIPEDWYSHVASLDSVTTEYPNGKFKVVLMKDLFFNFFSLLKVPPPQKAPLVLRKKTTEGEPFHWFRTQHFSYRRRDPGLLYTKACVTDADFKVLSFNRKGKRQKEARNLASLLPLCYSGPVPIPDKKKADLLSCLHLLDPEYHQFYHDLPSTRIDRDIDPDLPYNEAVAEEAELETLRAEDDDDLANGA